MANGSGHLVHRSLDRFKFKLSKSGCPKQVAIKVYDPNPIFYRLSQNQVDTHTHTHTHTHIYI